MSAPIYENLINYHNQNRISFAMPGHKGTRGLREGLLECDVTELPKTEDLHAMTKGVEESNRLLAELYGSDKSYIMTSGSTGCIQVMLSSVLKRGDTLLCTSDCHMSVINTCAIMGYKIKIAPKVINAEFNIPSGEAELEIDDSIKAVLVTSPNYYGITCDIEGLAKICHEKGIPLLVDEAHGAHFVVSDMLPESAIELGADAVCHSAHKTLNALTGAAYLHVKGSLIDKKRIERAISMFETSSPSYAIAASADTAREDIESEKKWEAIISLVRCFKFNIQYKTKIKPLINNDFSRLVLSFREYETTGFEVLKLLAEEYNIDIEMADMENIVMIVTPPNTNEEIDALFDALVKICEGLKERKERNAYVMPPVPDLINPEEAFFKESESVSLDLAKDKVSAVTVTVYPPGVPVIYQGATISEEMLEYIENIKNAGGKICGMDNGIEVIK